jgi:hypothetical protein
MSTKNKNGREWVIYPPIDQVKFLDPVELRVIRIKHEERMKYYERLEKFLELEEDALKIRPTKDFSDAITEAMIKTFNS